MSYHLIIDDQAAANVTLTSNTWTTYVGPSTGTEVEGSLLSAYNGTLTTVAKTSQSNLTVFFYGTSIQAYGGVGDASYSQQLNGQNATFQVDNLRANAISIWDAGVTSNTLFYSQSDLTFGEHALFVTIDAEVDAQGGSGAVFDYFLVTVPANESEALVGQTVVVDDASPWISYLDADNDWKAVTWVAGNISTTAFPYFNNTCHQPLASGANASISFDGTGITVYATLDPSVKAGVTLAQFTLDGDAATDFSVTSASAMVQPNTVLFNATHLSQGNHTLVMTTQVVDVFALDFMTLLGAPIDPSWKPPSQSRGPTSSRSHFSAILGGAVAGGAVTLALLAFLLFRRARTSRYLRINSGFKFAREQAEVETAACDPFIIHRAAAAHIPPTFTQKSHSTLSRNQAATAGIGDSVDVADTSSSLSVACSTVFAATSDIKSDPTSSTNVLETAPASAPTRASAEIPSNSSPNGPPPINLCTRPSPLVSAHSRFSLARETITSSPPEYTVD